MKLIQMMALAVVLALVGCGKGADTSKPVAEVKQDAQRMTVDDLHAKAAEYQKAITAKMAELEPLKQQLTQIPFTQQMGAGAQALQQDIMVTTKELNDLRERLQVHLDALKARGEPVSQYAN